MKDTKLIQILKIFSKEEIKEFEKFVASPYFSRGRDLKPFYKILKSYHPDFNSSNFNYERVFRKLYPKEKYNKSGADNILRVLSSELTRLAEEFITVRDLRTNEVRSRICLIEFFLNNNMNKFFMQLFSDTINNYDKLINGYTSRDFVDLYFLTMLNVAYNIHNNGKITSNMESQINLFIFFFLCAANFIQNSYKSRINFNVDNKDDLAEQFMRSFDHKNFISYLDKKKGIKETDKQIFELCFYSLMHTVERNNENFILKIETLFFKIRHLFSDNHKLSFYFILKLSYNKINDFKKLNRLYKYLLIDNIYAPTDGREIPFHLYIDILHNFIEQNKLADALKFIKKYTDYLRTDKKESFRNFGLALIEFKRKQFEKALDLISKVEMIYFFFKYDIRNLYLKIYYELNYSDEAYSMIDSYKHFLKNNKNVSDVQRLQNKQFLDYFKKLLDYKAAGANFELINLKKNVTAESKLPYKDWLLEKINEKKY